MTSVFNMRFYLGDKWLYVEVHELGNLFHGSSTSTNYWSHRYGVLVDLFEEVELLCLRCFSFLKCHVLSGGLIYLCMMLTYVSMASVRGSVRSLSICW